MVYVIAAVIGLITGAIVWLVMSHFIATSLAWAATRNPALTTSKRLRAGEIIMCGALFVICLALAFAVARLVAPHL